ncbi:BLUF domain-containing protein [Psychrobacter sp. NZS113]|uniref:BLUF domain-containing protein n=1 Tax=Psychrobacter sp. NZS113 TaxID=2792045 RepID=UPI0018CF05A3|nr:BLUF domain-containing protein [Psychrobacter sp. NZS113]MBH0096668.1 BLUF domain-containing protein [Psychrobacter sp. NZS113]
MKCIAYVSRAPISRASVRDHSVRMPTGLSDIISASREHNPKSQITGIVSYRDGQYFQVLEGPHLEVDKLMAKIAADSRHEDIWVFLDTGITERSFPNWIVSVFNFVDQRIFFNAFVENHRSIFNIFDDYQKNRIKSFIDINKIDTVPDIYYQGKNLRLLAWPDLNNESNPQMIMSLCIKLTKKPYPFDFLVDSGEFGTPQQVTQIVKEFERSGILSVTEAEPVVETVVNKKKPNKFYGAIKKFLGMR